MLAWCSAPMKCNKTWRVVAGPVRKPKELKKTTPKKYKNIMIMRNSVNLSKKKPKRLKTDSNLNDSTLQANDKRQRKVFKKSSLIKPRKKIKGVLGKIYCNATKNNTILTLVDTKGDTKGWSCSGSLGFKNARKSTTYAAQAAAESLVKKARALGYTHLRLRVKGLGRGKQSCLRALSKSGLKIISLEDKTSLPYNGCRGSKKRRV